MSSFDDHPELSCGYDPQAFVASIRKHISAGSRWVHKNGNVYTVLMLTNTESDDHFRYPPMVVYRGENGNVWSRKASDWDRSMRRQHAKKSRLLWFRTKMILAAIAMCITACVQSVTPSDYDQALRICDLNGGIERIFVTNEAVYSHCGNGAQFTFPKNR